MEFQRSLHLLPFLEETDFKTISRVLIRHQKTVIH